MVKVAMLEEEGSNSTVTISSLDDEEEKAASRRPTTTHPRLVRGVRVLLCQPAAERRRNIILISIKVRVCCLASSLSLTLLAAVPVRCSCGFTGSRAGERCVVGERRKQKATKLRKIFSIVGYGKSRFTIFLLDAAYRSLVLRSSITTVC